MKKLLVLILLAGCGGNVETAPIPFITPFKGYDSRGFPSIGGAAASFTVANVKMYGARCDGTTDDTTAIQAAFTASRLVYIPENSTCIAGPLTVSNSGTVFFGAGTSSVLKVRSNVTSSTFITGGANLVGFHHVTVQGTLTASCKTGCASTPLIDGVTLTSNRNVNIHHATVHGFDRRALYFLDTATDRLTHAEVDSVALYNNGFGLQSSVSFTEYVRFTNLDVNNNGYGVLLDSGNMALTNSKVNDNGVNVFLYGTGVANNGHGIIANNLITHAGTYNIDATDISLGEVITGNTIIDGTIRLTTCTGIVFSGNIINVGSLTFSGGGRNVFVNNMRYSNAFSNTITHNSDNTIVYPIHVYDGSSADGDVCVDIAGDAACVTSPHGFVVVDAADTSTVVSTKAVNAKSRVNVWDCAGFESTYDAVGATTCNASKLVFPAVSAFTTGTSFTVTTYAYADGAATAPTTDPLCVCYEIGP